MTTFPREVITIGLYYNEDLALWTLVLIPLDPPGEPRPLFSVSWEHLVIFATTLNETIARVHAEGTTPKPLDPIEIIRDAEDLFKGNG